MVPAAGRAEEVQRAAGLKKVPLDGFMGEAEESENARFSKAFWWSTVAFGRTLPGLSVEYLGIVLARPKYLLPSLGFQVRSIKGRGPAPCLFFKTSDR